MTIRAEPPSAVPPSATPPSAVPPSAVPPTAASADPLLSIDRWPVPTAAAGWLGADGRGGTRGPTARPFRVASITKPLVSLAVLVAVEEGSLALDQPAGPVGSTLRHLLSHSSGMAPDAAEPIAPVGTRRIYSNAGFDAVGRLLEAATGFSMAQYLHEAVVDPLGLTSTRLDGSPAHAAVSCVDDLLIVIAELLAPTLLAPETIREATTPHLPMLGGVVPGYGRHDPNSWGLGFEIRNGKSPHWTSTENNPSTFGHFGRAGTMFWVDPTAGVGCVALTDREFGQWAIDAWPELGTAVARSA